MRVAPRAPALRRIRGRCGLAIAAAVVAVTGCGSAPHTRGAGAVSPLSVRAVAWNPTGVSFGRVRAVADAGGVVAVFADAGASVLGSGAVVATDRGASDWVDAGTMRAADGDGRWIVGIDRGGHVRYLRGLTSFDDVSARYGLDGRPVRALTMLTPGRVGFLLDGEIAVADGSRVARYAASGWTTLVGGHGVGVGVKTDEAVVFDAATLASRVYALPGVTAAAVGADGRVYLATRRAIYASTTAGDLALVYDAERESIHGLVAAGRQVWFADGAELGLVQTAGVAETAGAHLPVDAAISASSSGDVWVLAGGALRRFAIGAGGEDAAWRETVSPVFARACASCHQANGVAGVDLSTAAAWEAERATIRSRVLVSRTMPPEGHPLSDADRRAIRAWVDGRGAP